jgi:hypothetical protein
LVKANLAGILAAAVPASASAAKSATGLKPRYARLDEIFAARKPTDGVV